MNFIRNFLQGKEVGTKQSPPSNSSFQTTHENIYGCGNVDQDSVDHIRSQEEILTGSPATERLSGSFENEVINGNNVLPLTVIKNQENELTLVRAEASFSSFSSAEYGYEIEQTAGYKNDTLNELVTASSNEPRHTEYFDCEEAVSINALSFETSVSHSGENTSNKVFNFPEHSTQDTHIDVEVLYKQDQLNKTEQSEDSSSNLYLLEEFKGSEIQIYQEENSTSFHLGKDFGENLPSRDTCEPPVTNATYESPENSSFNTQLTLQKEPVISADSIGECSASTESSNITNNTFDQSPEHFEENLNYLEFGFENNNKPLKQIPKRLGKRHQERKKASKEKSNSNREQNKRNALENEKTVGLPPGKNLKEINNTNSEIIYTEVSDNNIPTVEEGHISLISEDNDIIFNSDRSCNQRLVSDTEKICKPYSDPIKDFIPNSSVNSTSSTAAADVCTTTNEQEIAVIGNENIVSTELFEKPEVFILPNEQLPLLLDGNEQISKILQNNCSVLIANKTDFCQSNILCEENKELENPFKNNSEYSGNFVVSEKEFNSSIKLRTKDNSENTEKSDNLFDRKAKNRNSLISLSCYGNEEFEKLGHEANLLAEELSDCKISTCDSRDKLTMEERDCKSAREGKGDGSSSSRNRESSSSIDETKQSSEIKFRSSKKKDTLILQVNHSEAGPDVATGLTSSDLRCASEFFREAAELENQIRRNIASSLGSLNDFGVEGDRSSFGSECDGYTSNKGMQPTSPPREERSAPEGTSSPDPRSLEDSEVRNRPRSSDSLTSDEVNEILKKQALKFEEKLLRQGIVAAEKEKQLHEVLKDEQNQLQKVTASRDALLKLVEQYKGMLASLVADKDKMCNNQDDKVNTLEAEKRQALEDLSNVEAAFSDVHRKYERTKQIVDSLRRNEETLRNAVADYEEKLLKQERKFSELQKHAEEKVKQANQEFETLRRSNDQEMTKMSALLKKAEMKIISLQDALERKTRENQELTQLCDDLISKVGS